MSPALFQDPQQSAAPSGVPSGPTHKFTSSGPPQRWQLFKPGMGQEQRRGGQTGEEHNFSIKPPLLGC